MLVRRHVSFLSGKALPLESDVTAVNRQIGIRVRESGFWILTHSFTELSLSMGFNGIAVDRLTPRTILLIPM